VKRALITGVGGQDGSYLAELLLDKGYIVHGMIRRSSTPNLSRIEHLKESINLHYGEMTDAGSIASIVKQSKPDEIYNLAAMSQVRISYDIPAATLDVTGVGFARLLEAVRSHAPDAKVLQTSSSEMFGKVLETPQKETTPFYPRSPYGVAKAAAFNLGRVYREGHKLWVSNSICFNHESPRRGVEFLSKKVVMGAVAIKQGRQSKLYLGNLDAKRDMGYAKEYCYWMWKILQHDRPDDFVLATEETHSMEEFVDATFCALGMDWRQHVVIDDHLKRPAEVDLLVGDATKARSWLGFVPKVKFAELVNIMVQAELVGGDVPRLVAA
jgi:GDPmannose 4,6-dehydratase